VDPDRIVQDLTEMEGRYEATLVFRERDVRDEYIDALRSGLEALCRVIDIVCKGE